MWRPLLGICLGAAISVTGVAQVRTAADVLGDMRVALGGDAALDAVRAFQVSGSVTETHGQFRKGFAYEWFALLPDHYLEIKRDRDMSVRAPIEIDITYYSGFRGDERIHRVDSSIPMPPPPPTSDVDVVRKQKQSFARIALALFGTVPGEKVETAYVGREELDGQSVEAIDVRLSDGFAMRLFVDAATHLPHSVHWQAPPDVTMTTSSTAVVRNNEVISQSFPLPLAGPPASGDLVTRTLSFDDFKVQDGLNWPHRLRGTVDSTENLDRRLGKFKINPKLDAKRFNVRD